MPDPEIVGPQTDPPEFAAAPEAPAPAAPEPAPVEAAKPETFSREYVEDLRRENAGYRTRFRPYEELFDGLDDGTAESVKALIEIVKSGDPAASAEAIKLLGGEVPNLEPNYATPEQVQEMLAERDAQLAEQTAMSDIYRRAEGLGYKQNTEEMVRLLWRMNNMPEPDMEAAHKAIQAEEQAIIDRYVESKRQPTVAPVTSGSPPAEKPHDGTWETAKARARERVRAEQG